MSPKMNVSTQAGLLSDAVSVASAIERSDKNPCFARLSATESGLSIVCTDTAVGTIATNVAATIYEQGELAVSASRLAAVLCSYLRDAPIEVKATAGGVIIQSGESRVQLPAISVDESPSAMAIEQQIGQVEIRSIDLWRALEPLAVATDHTRPYLLGVFLHSVENELVAVSTDGRRLIRTAATARYFSEDRRLIVSAEAGAIVRRLLREVGTCRVVLRRSPSLISFSVGPFVFTARLIDGIYPAYERLIPAPTSNTVRCDRLALIAASSRLLAVAPSNDTSLLALSWGSGNNLNLCLARHPMAGADAVAAEVGGSAEVAVSLPHFVALLKELKGKRIWIEIAGDQPVVIRDMTEKLALLVQSKWAFGARGARS